MSRERSPALLNINNSNNSTGTTANHKEIILLIKELIGQTLKSNKITSVNKGNLEEKLLCRLTATILSQGLVIQKRYNHLGIYPSRFSEIRSQCHQFYYFLFYLYYINISKIKIEYRNLLENKLILENNNINCNKSTNLSLNSYN